MRVIRAPDRLPGGPYTVQFAPDAWNQVGALPWDVFEELQRSLAQFADVNGALARPDATTNNVDADRATFELNVARYRCIVDIDAERRQLTLVSIERD